MEAFIIARCQFFHVECSCGKYKCNAVNPPKMIMDYKICHQPDHKTECLLYEKGVKMIEDINRNKREGVRWK